jgi:hypothetical protein
MSQYSAAEHSGTQKATENGLNVVRFYTGELRFHLKKRKFLAQTEIVSALSATQSSSARLGAVFHWASSFNDQRHTFTPQQAKETR